MSGWQYSARREVRKLSLNLLRNPAPRDTSVPEFLAPNGVSRRNAYPIETRIPVATRTANLEKKTPASVGKILPIQSPNFLGVIETAILHHAGTRDHQELAKSSARIQSRPPLEATLAADELLTRIAAPLEHEDVGQLTCSAQLGCVNLSSAEARRVASTLMAGRRRSQSENSGDVTVFGGARCAESGEVGRSPV